MCVCRGPGGGQGGELAAKGTGLDWLPFFFQYST